MKDSPPNTAKKIMFNKRKGKQNPISSGRMKLNETKVQWIFKIWKSNLFLQILIDLCPLIYLNISTLNYIEHLVWDISSHKFTFIWNVILFLPHLIWVIQLCPIFPEHCPAVVKCISWCIPSLHFCKTNCHSTDGKVGLGVWTCWEG